MDGLEMDNKPEQRALFDRTIVRDRCGRIRFSASILAHRRKGKQAYLIEDEYDVQDLLSACVRSVLNDSVEEDTISKIAGVGSRADFSIERVGLLVEVKFARETGDLKKFSQAISQDLVLYSTWHALAELVVVIYNSGALRDPEALAALAGPKEINGKRFHLTVVLT
jgi:hypothetical protein